MEEESIQNFFYTYNKIVPYIINCKSPLSPQIVFIGHICPIEDRLLIAVGQLESNGQFSILPAEGADPITIDSLYEKAFYLGLQETPDGVGTFIVILDSKGRLNLPLPSYDTFKEAISSIESNTEIELICRNITNHIIFILESGECLGEPLDNEFLAEVHDYNDFFRNKDIDRLLKEMGLNWQQ